MIQTILLSIVIALVIWCIGYAILILTVLLSGSLKDSPRGEEEC